MKMKTVLVLASVFILVLVAGSAMAGDPLKRDEEFLESDPDQDYIPTWMEFILGTDPYNADSDNDGLPDNWEYENLMDPADASDAHLDYDYLPQGEGLVGERDCEFNFRAIKKDIDIWPANRDMSFEDLVFIEDGIHYDNYEEYYRPYHDQYDEYKIKIMHTRPRDSNTDDDWLLDPDDYEPLNYDNDGVGAGGADIIDTDDNDEYYMEKAPEVKLKNQEITPVLPFNEIEDYLVDDKFEIDIDNNNFKSQPPTNDEKKAVDMDNDGI
jgi:hypothetical protein